ncbi:putative G protein-coupled receptor 89 isoform 5 [Cardiosporidium cionae]|uniref:G protein-coupled receptor 89 isoform 5 n=1 Tax=Cardiosporidium cionae TaxID=476202 RepID=A0ABQ7J7J8_9APIC|nr:putative G protein-coupled receptor 89 isoform 5 [Cardiosporidium cionae]|eukprot:KAF8819946.1 putative G protein-coupled receptor 89 isoform 5 [Cardiosporidium cionae]
MMLAVPVTFSMVTGVIMLLVFHSSLFMGAYWFFAKQLYRDYEVKCASTQYLFALAFTSCISMLQLLLLELLHVLDPLVRRWIWSVDLLLVLSLVYVILPVAFVYTIIGHTEKYPSRLTEDTSSPVSVQDVYSNNTASSIKISKKQDKGRGSIVMWLIRTICMYPQRRYKEMIGCFFFLPCVWLFFYELGGALLFRKPLQLSIASSTEQLLAYMGVCGVTIVSALAGFGSINFPYRIIHAHLYPIKQRDMVELEMHITQILRLLSEKQGKCAVLRQSWRSTIRSLTPYVKEHWPSPMTHTPYLPHTSSLPLTHSSNFLSAGKGLPITMMGFPFSTEGGHSSPSDSLPASTGLTATIFDGLPVDRTHVASGGATHQFNYRACHSSFFSNNVTIASTTMPLPISHSYSSTKCLFSPPITSEYSNTNDGISSLLDQRMPSRRVSIDTNNDLLSSPPIGLTGVHEKGFGYSGIAARLQRGWQTMVAIFLPSKADSHNFSKAEYNKMQAEIHALEKLLGEYTVILNSLAKQGMQKSKQANRLLYRWIRNIAGWLMTIVCIYRVSMASMNVMMNSGIWTFHRMKSSPGISMDPSTRLLSAAFSLFHISTDISFWAPYVSMILMGWIIALNIRGFIEKALIAFRYLSTPISSNVLALIMSEVMCLYFSACALLMRMHLPLQYREAISEVLGQSLDFSAFHFHFDVVFVISCGMSLLLIIISQNFKLEKFKLI